MISSTKYVWAGVGGTVAAGTTGVITELMTPWLGSVMPAGGLVVE